MPTQEIAAQNWLPFFDTFSKQHADAAANVQVISPDLGSQEVSGGLPLAGISFDEKGSEEGSIVLMLGTDTETHLEHIIEKPAHVWHKSSAAGNDDAIEIEAADQTKTIVQIQPLSAIPK